MHGGGRIMAWVCTAASEIHYDNSRMNSEVYRNILSVSLQRTFIMQQGSDPKHAANMTKGFVREKNGKVLDWPN